MVSVTPAADAIKDVAGNSLAAAKVVGTNAGDGAAPSLPPDNIAGATVQDGGDAITLDFSEAVRRAAGGTFDANDFASIKSPSTGGALSLTNATFSLSTDRKRLIITLDEATDGVFLTNDNDVAVKPATGAILDLAGNVHPDDEIVSSGVVAGDSAAPSISTTMTATTVEDGNDTIVITFSEEVQPDDGTFSNNEFSFIKDVNGNNALTFANAIFTLSSDRKFLTIKLDEATDDAFLTNGLFVALTPVANKIKDLAGNSMATNEVTSTNATTGETDAPSISTTMTATTIVDTGDTILITFSEAVQADDGTFSNNEFSFIKDVNGNNALTFANATFGLSANKKGGYTLTTRKEG